MDSINQETLEKMTNNWKSFATQFEKLGNLIEDMGNCKSDYTKSVLFSAVTKIAEQLGLKEKIIG